jgi:hypothetical protein
MVEDASIRAAHADLLPIITYTAEIMGKAANCTLMKIPVGHMITRNASLPSEQFLWS